MLTLVRWVLTRSYGGSSCEGSLASMDHVVDTVSVFLLDVYALTLEQAVEMNSLLLVQCLLAPLAAKADADADADFHSKALSSGGFGFGKCFGCKEMESAAVAAVSTNRLAALRLLEEQLDRQDCWESLLWQPHEETTLSPSLVELAASHGHLEVFQYLWGCFCGLFAASDESDDCYDAGGARTNSASRNCSWSKPPSRAACRRRVLVQAASHGHLTIVRCVFCLENEPTRQVLPHDVVDVGIVQAAQVAASKGHLDIVAFCWQRLATEHKQFVSSLLPFALAHSRIQILFWLERVVLNGTKAMDCLELTPFKSLAFLKQLIKSPEEARRDNRPPLDVQQTLDWLVSNQFPFWQLFAELNDLFLFACEEGDFPFVSWLWHNEDWNCCSLGAREDPNADSKAELLHRSIQIVCAKGHLPLLGLLIDRVDLSWWPSVSSSLHGAVANGHLEVVRLVLEYATTAQQQTIGAESLQQLVTQEAMEMAALNGHVKMLQFFSSRFKCRGKCFEEVIYTAAETGNVSMLQLVLSGGKESEDDQAMTSTLYEALDRAIRRNHQQVVEFLYWIVRKRSNDILLAVMEAVNAAAIVGNFEALKFLLVQGEDVATVTRESATPHLGFVIDKACEEKRMDLVKLLHERRANGFTTFAMDAAAAAGSLSIVRFLHDCREEGCTTSAMNHAALGGYLHIVQFLHANRHEGCTSLAMDLAASNGHLQVVRFLHYHRREGCTEAAMNAAAWKGHLEVVKFLFAKRYESCPAQALQHAVSNRQLKIVRLLVAYLERNGRISSSTLAMAVQSRHVNIVQALVAASGPATIKQALRLVREDQANDPNDSVLGSIISHLERLLD